MRGRFITLEGGEGSGKTSNIAYIKSVLDENKISVILTREPGGTPLAEAMRQILLDSKQESITEQAELLMMFAARAQHIEHVIKPALKQGTWVLCDRFTDSTFAYQGEGRGMKREIIQWLEQFVQEGLKPDLTLLLDVPVEIGMQRAAQRGKLDRFESEKIAFFEKVRNAFLTMAEQQPERIKVIDATQQLEQVQASIYPLITQFMAK